MRGGSAKERVWPQRAMLAGTSSSTPPLSSTCRFTLLLLQLCGLAQAQDRCRPGQCRAKGCFLSCPDCHACSAGYRCPATGGGDKSICYTEGRFPCPAGTHAPTGSASCPICPANTWSPATASGCTACPAGRFSPRQSTSVAACVDPCDGVECNHHGSCRAVNASSHVCECAEGWTGSSCTANACDGVTCNRHGTCKTDGGHTACECDPGWSGGSCTVDLCNDVTCNNHGSCRGVDGGHECECDAGWSGRSCTVNACDGVTCNNHGTCIGNAKCSCDPGWSGTSCQTQAPTGPLLACGSAGGDLSDNSMKILGIFKMVKGVCSQQGERCTNSSIFCETCASSECQRVVTLVQDSCDPVFRKDGFLRQAFYPELATAVSTCDNAAKSSHHVVRTVHCHCICHVISLFRGH